MSICAELRSVVKEYDGVRTLGPVTATFSMGRMAAITGPSGAGKSTLLNILGLLESPTGGDLSLFGSEAPRINSSQATRLLRSKIGYLFQNFALIDNDTVRDNLRLAQRYSVGAGVSISEALERVGLSGYERRKVATLSGGEQQRIAIARLLIKPCELVLADEPTGSLDHENRDIVLRHLEDLRASGKSVVVVTHDSEVAGRCDEVLDLVPARRSE